MSTTLQTTIAEEVARLETRDVEHLVAGDSFVRYWPDISNQAAGGLMLTLRTTATVVGPYADGHVVSGTFALGRVWCMESDASERAVTIYQTLTKTWTYSEAEGEDGLPTPIPMARIQVLDAFSLSEGVDYVEGRRYLNLNPASKAEFMAMTITPPTGYTEKDRRWDVDDGEKRTATMSILFRKVTWQAFDYTSPDYFYYTQQDTDYQIKIEVWDGILNSDVLTGLYTVDTPATLHVIEARLRDNRNGSMGVSRTVVTRVTEATLDGQAIQRPHALSTGTIDSRRIIYDNYTLARIEAITDVPVPAGYTLNGFEDNYAGTKLRRRIYTCTKATWNDFDVDNPTFSYTLNPEGWGKTIWDVWEGVVNSDKLTGLYTAPSGYVIKNTTVTDTHDGALSIRRERSRLLDGKQTTSYSTIRPHGWDTITVSSIEATYDNYVPGSLPDKSSFPAGYTLIEWPTVINSNGHLRRVYLLESVTYPNAVDGSTSLPATSRVVSMSGHDSQNDNAITRTLEYKGFNIDTYGASALAALSVSQDANTYVVDSATIGEGARGEAVIRRVLRMANTLTAESDGIMREASLKDGSTADGFLRWWPNLTSSAADTLITTLRANSTFLGLEKPGQDDEYDQYDNAKLWRQPVGDTGLFNVMQHGTNDIGSESWYDGKYVESHRIFQYYVPSDIGEKVGYVCRIDKYCTANYLGALTFCKSSSYMLTERRPYAATTPGSETPREGSIDRLEPQGLYLAERILWTKAKTLNAGVGDFNDLGDMSPQDPPNPFIYA